MSKKPHTAEDPVKEEHKKNRGSTVSRFFLIPARFKSEIVATPLRKKAPFVLQHDNINGSLRQKRQEVVCFQSANLRICISKTFVMIIRSIRCALLYDPIVDYGSVRSSFLKRRCYDTTVLLRCRSDGRLQIV